MKEHFLLKEFTYVASEAELSSLAQEIRFSASTHACIDAERLGIVITSVASYQWAGEETYFRAATADVTLDGRAFGSDRIERKIRWYVQQTMISVKHKPDPARLTLIHDWVRRESDDAPPLLRDAAK